MLFRALLVATIVTLSLSPTAQASRLGQCVVGARTLASKLLSWKTPKSRSETPAETWVRENPTLTKEERAFYFKLLSTTGWEDQRGLVAYFQELIAANGAFNSSLENVWRNNGRWLDIGGEGQALQEYNELISEDPHLGSWLQRWIGFTLPNAEVPVELVGITATPTQIGMGRVSNARRDRKSVVDALNKLASERQQAFKGRFHILEGQLVEQVDPQKLGTFELVTDIKSSMWYSPRPMDVLSVLLQLTRSNGRLIFTIPTGKTVNTKADGEMELGLWLSQVLGSHASVGTPDAERPYYTITIFKNPEWGDSLPFTLPDLSFAGLNADQVNSHSRFTEGPRN